MYEQFALSAFTVLMSIFGSYAILKYATRTAKIIEISEVIVEHTLDHITTDTNKQKQIYLLGALLGNGIKQGIGIGKTGGKFKFEDVIAQGAMGFINQLLSGQQKGTVTQSKPLNSLDL